MVKAGKKKKSQKQIAHERRQAKQKKIQRKKKALVAKKHQAFCESISS